MKSFEGCGSLNSEIKRRVGQEFSQLNGLLKSISKLHQTDKNELLKVWLFACLMKTLKEQAGLGHKIDGLVNYHSDID